MKRTDVKVGVWYWVHQGQRLPMARMQCVNIPKKGRIEMRHEKQDRAVGISEYERLKAKMPTPAVEEKMKTIIRGKQVMVTHTALVSECDPPKWVPLLTDVKVST